MVQCSFSALVLFWSLLSAFGSNQLVKWLGFLGSVLRSLYRHLGSHFSSEFLELKIRNFPLDFSILFLFFQLVFSLCCMPFLHWGFRIEMKEKGSLASGEYSPFKIKGFLWEIVTVLDSFVLQSSRGAVILPSLHLLSWF